MEMMCIQRYTKYDVEKCLLVEAFFWGFEFDAPAGEYWPLKANARSRGYIVVISFYQFLGTWDWLTASEPKSEP